MNAVAILERAVAFLLAQQGQDGLWRDFRTLGGEAADWPSGFIAAQLVAAGAPRTPLESAARAMTVVGTRTGGRRHSMGHCRRFAWDVRSATGHVPRSKKQSHGLSANSGRTAVSVTLGQARQHLRRLWDS